MYALRKDAIELEESNVDAIKSSKTNADGANDFAYAIGGDAIELDEVNAGAIDVIEWNADAINVIESNIEVTKSNLLDQMQVVQTVLCMQVMR